ncbi:hypothetical protein DLAC_00841 [Tieghemostelium lacteum]|uniref:Uncharacterized protein n=1 Tax=Tieghemostelium lacteum TaxID=361077 RepID=A0A152A773_TIELA|nr:hypothetical protein DLAC_00841 [Tieghemostelium lacteum]|eukprot:KYR02044.1 hypothetical protein DLAC_00841 [Tieghemostelium lacteum]
MQTNNKIDEWALKRKEIITKNSRQSILSEKATQIFYSLIQNIPPYESETLELTFSSVTLHEFKKLGFTLEELGEEMNRQLRTVQDFNGYVIVNNNGITYYDY